MELVCRYAQLWWKTPFIPNMPVTFSSQMSHIHLQLLPLLWRHNGRDSVSNHQPHDCLLNRLFRRRSKYTSKLRVTGLCAGNSPGTGEFPAQMASNAANVSIWWRHHDRYTYWLVDFHFAWVKLHAFTYLSRSFYLIYVKWFHLVSSLVTKKSFKARMLKFWIASGFCYSQCYWRQWIPSLKCSFDTFVKVSDFTENGF